MLTYTDIWIHKSVVSITYGISGIFLFLSISSLLILPAYSLIQALPIFSFVQT